MSEWISIKDRLPSDYDFVLVLACNLGTDEPKPVSIARLYPGGNWDFLGQPVLMNFVGAWMDIEYNMDEDTITHWMPLPKPDDISMISVKKYVDGNFIKAIDGSYHNTMHMKSIYVGGCEELGYRICCSYDKFCGKHFVETFSFGRTHKTWDTCQKELDIFIRDLDRSAKK